MNINIGTRNPVKIEAVREAIRDYIMMRGSHIKAVDVQSGVHKQPKTLEETINGAMNRAKSAFSECTYSFGIESGMMQVPHTKSGYMDVTVCAIFDGKRYHLGMSSCFEYPYEVTRRLFSNGADVNEAAIEAGFTDKKAIGTSEGMIGLLTKGRLNRKEYTKQSIMMAMIHLENPEHYR